VANKLILDWSPEQIAGWLYIQARGMLKKEILKHLRSRRMMSSSTVGQPRGQIIDAVSISLRPPEAEDRAVSGHWEGDLIMGSKNSHIATLVERQSRFVLLVQTDGKYTASVVDALIRQVKQLPVGLMATLTWDRGTELAQHKRFTLATDVGMYFCDPRSPWQRGTNENTNRLLSQYFPKGTDLSGS
jgi:IS30 family transposase